MSAIPETPSFTTNCFLTARHDGGAGGGGGRGALGHALCVDGAARPCRAVGCAAVVLDVARARGSAVARVVGPTTTVRLVGWSGVCLSRIACCGLLTGGEQSTRRLCPH